MLLPDQSLYSDNKVVKQAGYVTVYTITMITAPVRLSLSN